MSQAMHDHFHFVDLVGSALASLGYKVQKEVPLEDSGKKIYADFLISKGKSKKIVEVKLYTINSDSYEHFKRAYIRLSDSLKLMPEYTGLLITNGKINIEWIGKLNAGYRLSLIHI